MPAGHTDTHAIPHAQLHKCIHKHRHTCTHTLKIPALSRQPSVTLLSLQKTGFIPLSGLSAWELQCKPSPAWHSGCENGGTISLAARPPHLPTRPRKTCRRVGLPFHPPYPSAPWTPLTTGLCPPLLPTPERDKDIVNHLSPHPPVSRRQDRVSKHHLLCRGWLAG